MIQGGEEIDKPVVRTLAQTYQAFGSGRQLPAAARYE